MALEFFNQVRPGKDVYNQLFKLTLNIVVSFDTMNYLVTVLENKQQAEEAYSILQKDGIAPEKITILGQGYQSADEFGLINPNHQASKRAGKLAYMLIPFGFVAGYVFNLLTGIHLFSLVRA